MLKPTGSIYLHCDPTASAYLRLLMDCVFGVKNFKNEIIWKRADAHNDPQRYGSIHDVILYFSKSRVCTWNTVYTEYSESYLEEKWNKAPSGRLYKCDDMTDPRKSMEEYDFMGSVARWRTGYDKMMDLWNAPQTEVPSSHGRIKLTRNGVPRKDCRITFLDERKGVPLQDIWTDVLSLRGGAREKLGYPTQKPVTLLERIVKSSSNPGDVVLDPFCGCGTTIAAAQQLGRTWLGIDITHIAISLIKARLADTFIDNPPTYTEVNIPTTSAEARALALQDRHEFQKWAVSLVPRAYPSQDKKGADHGIDGILRFQDDAKDPKRCIIQVKSGHIQVKEIRDLRGTMEREKATLALFISLDDPTGPMKKEADVAGFYTTPLGNKPISRLQIRTVGELLAGNRFDIPLSAELFGIKQAPVAQAPTTQVTLEI